MNNNIAALIIAAGKGERMKEVSSLPKALTKIAGETLLNHTIKRILKTGIKNIFLVIRYEKSLFEDYIKSFNDKCLTKIELIVLSESSYMDSPVNDIINAANQIKQPFSNLLISYCDTITDFQLKNIIMLHFEKDSFATLLLFSDDNTLFKHKYSMNKEGQITSIDEFEMNNQIKYAQGGIYILNKKLIEKYTPNTKIEFSINDGPIVKAFEEKRLYGISTDDFYFMEIGTPSNFHICESKLNARPDLKEKLFK